MMQIWWNKRYFKANLVILKIMENSVEKIEHIFINMPHFHMHFLFVCFLNTL